MEDLDVKERLLLKAAEDLSVGVIEMGDMAQRKQILSIVKQEINEDVPNLTLHQCARNGDVKSAKLLINKMGEAVREKVNVKDTEKLTPLHYAARYNRLELLKLLINHGADITARDEDGLTPLHYASRFKKKSEDGEKCGEMSSTIDFLVNKGMDSTDGRMGDNDIINVTDHYGQTPLHFAAMRGNEVACMTLIKCGASLEVMDKQGMTPLHMAAYHNQREICEILIDSGANLRCKDEENNTPLHAACAEGNQPIVRMLFNTGSKQTYDMLADKDIDGNTCLNLAVENGRYEVVGLCIEKGADVNTPNNIYMYPLHQAAVNGDTRIVRLLIEHNARIDALNNEQATPLHKACQYNHWKVAKHLLKKGADIERNDKENYTPLLLASVFGHASTVDFLLQKNADVTTLDKNDRSAIFLAAEENHLGALEALLRHEHMRRMINVSDRYSNYPLHIAAMKGYLSIVRCLLNNGADMDCKNEMEQTPFHLAAKYGRAKIILELLSRKVTAVNDQDEESNTALHLAAIDGHDSVAALLIKHKADVAARNENMWTPLDCAAAYGNLKAAEVLLEADSPIDPVDKAKTTPLHLAARYGHTDVLKLLISWGADVGKRDVKGLNSLDLAIDNNHSSTASAIIKSNYWQEALRNHTLDLNTGRHDTPMRKLIRKMPDVAQKVFNRCMTENQVSPEIKDYEITFDFEFLDDQYYILHWREDDSGDSTFSPGSIFDDRGSLMKTAKPYTFDTSYSMKNHPLMIMCKSQREELLAHPVVTALLHHKWKSFGRPYYYIVTLLYLVFLFFLTGYMVQGHPPYNEDPAVSNQTNGRNYCEKLQNSGKQPVPGFSRAAGYIILILASFNLLREIAQMYQARFNYINVQNVIELVTYITSLLLVIDIDTCQSDTGYRYGWQWYCGTCAIFLAWMDLVLFVQLYPRFGIYVVMVQDILTTFLQFAVVFMLFVFAFALAFLCVLQNQETFRTPWQSLIKTGVMMIGEFDYDSIYTEGEVDNKPLAYVFFCVFVVVMSIIIMNLLVGLAVDNIKEVQEQAELRRRAMRVELALDVERMIPEFFCRRYMRRERTFKPNVVTFGSSLFGMHSYDVTAETISQALHPELNELEKEKGRRKKLQNTVDNMSSTQEEIKASITNLEDKVDSKLKSIDQMLKVLVFTKGNAEETKPFGHRRGSWS